MPLSDSQLLEISRQQRAGEPIRLPPPVRKRKRDNRESRDQMSVMRWWSLVHRQHQLPDFALCAIPNGGRRDAITGVMLKKEGARAGAPDYMLLAKRKGYGALFVEQKTPEGRVRPEQDDFHSYLVGAGYKVVVARSPSAAMREIEGYLSL